MRRPLLFLSYRRDDVGPIALALRAEFELRLDGVPVFVDVNRIHGSDVWPESLDAALAKAKVLVALIGENWVGPRKAAPPRIMDDGDWVRREIEHGLSRSSATVLPVLINGAGMPDASLLPEGLKPILDLNAISLRTASWDQDLRSFCELLGRKFEIGIKHSDEILPEPSPIKKLVDPLGDDKLAKLKEGGSLPGWTVETTHDLLLTGAVREFLKKTYRFKKTAQVFAFLDEIGKLVERRRHHPLLEVGYLAVTARLSTWDAGHCITNYDAEMAIDLDQAAKKHG